LILPSSFLFESAQFYGNEKEVGQAVSAQEGWKREDIWVTTKVSLGKGLLRF